MSILYSCVRYSPSCSLNGLTAAPGQKRVGVSVDSAVRRPGNETDSPTFMRRIISNMPTESVSNTGNASPANPSTG